MSKPLVIDLFCGLGGWTERFLAEGYEVVGFDNQRHVYGDQRYPAQLVLQDVLTLQGSQFRDAAVIVANPPCQEYSYMAMPWSRAKQIAKALRGDGEFPEPYEGSRTIPELNALFEACFRIQREAIEATGHGCLACYGLGPRHPGHVCPKCKGEPCWFTRHIPLIVENVKGAQPWVGRAKANYGSFYLWGDVDSIGGRIVRAGAVKFGMSSVKASVRGQKVPGFNFHQYETNGKGGSFQTAATKVSGISFSGYGTPGYKPQGFNVTAAQRYREGVKVASEEGRRTDVGNGARFTSRDCGAEGVKNGNDWFGSGDNCSEQRKASSKSDSRKAASAQIAKIPPPLARWIAQVFKPEASEGARGKAATGEPAPRKAPTKNETERPLCQQQ